MQKDVMNVAFLGLGGNVGNRLENLDNMVKAMQLRCGEVIKISGVYETDAWGSDSEKKYLNQVVELRTLLTAEQLLQATMEIEKKLGRERTGLQNADRTSDIDILLYNDSHIDLDHFHVPHPRMHLRKFVLIPLCEIAPDLIHPELKKSISTLLYECEDTLEVKAFRK